MASLSPFLSSLLMLYFVLTSLAKALVAWALDHRRSVVVVAFLAFLAGAMAFFALESEFVPGWDRGEFQVRLTTAPDASLDESRSRLQAVLAAVEDIPEIEHSYATIGARDTDTVRDGLVYFRLTDMAADFRQAVA